MTTPLTSADEIDLSAGVLAKGAPLDENTFFMVSNFKTIKAVTRDPALLQTSNKKARDLDPDLEREQDIHELIQRALNSGKSKNAEKYADYIEAKVTGTSIGVLPPMHLWCAEPLKQITTASGTYVIVPHDLKLLAIDGETQLTAHYKLDGRPSMTAEAHKAHRELPLGAIVHHGIDTRYARQYFHDLNVLAVRPNTSLSLGMDTHDPITRVVETVEAEVPALTGRVDKQARQLTKTTNKIVTLTNLRQMVIDTAKGISGIQYGARPMPTEGLDLDVLTKVASSWIKLIFDEFAKEVSDREKYLISSGAVLASIGAMGQSVFTAPPEERPAVADKLLASLKDVDWAKGEHWVGIAGNHTKSGAFSVKGTKEVAYAVHTALTDPDSATYKRVRHQQPSELDQTNDWS